MTCETLLDIDDFEVKSWETLIRKAQECGKGKEAIKKLCDFIYITNIPIRSELNEYAVKRLGDFAHEDHLEKIRKYMEKKKTRRVRMF